MLAGMVLSALATVAVLAAPASDPGPAATSRAFQDLVVSRPARACRRHLTPAARRQWSATVQTITCGKDRADPGEERDRFRYRVVAGPASRVARVEQALIDESAICFVDGRKLFLARTDTLVRRDGRWRIARFGFGRTRCTA